MSHLELMERVFSWREREANFFLGGEGEAEKEDLAKLIHGEATRTPVITVIRTDDGKRVGVASMWPLQKETVRSVSQK